MQLNRSSLHFVRLTLDIVFLIQSYLYAHYISHGVFPASQIHNDILLLVSLIFVWLLTTKSSGLYDEFRSRNFSYELVLLIRNLFFQALALIITLFLIEERTIPRLFVIHFISHFFFFGFLEKALIRKYLNYIRRRGRNQRSMLIIGAGQVGRGFYDAVKSNPHFGYKLVGFLDDKKPENINGEYIGPVKELGNVLNNKQVDNVIIALPNYATEKFEEVIRVCEKHTTRVKIIPDYFRFFSNRYNISMFGPFPVIAVREDRLDEFHYRLLKRTFDIIFSFLIICFVMSWLVPLIAITIKATSKGPVFFRQERWGRNNHKFSAFKFRSMISNSKDVDEKGKYQQAGKDDPRVTKIGKLLRKTNLDELPQFFNVLIGHMSVVGPRPHPTPLNIESRETIQYYMLRHLVKPGITGWAQVNGYRGETKNLKLMQKRIDHDLWYIENWSLLLDIQIIFLTVWRMIKGDPNAY